RKSGRVSLARVGQPASAAPSAGTPVALLERRWTYKPHFSRRVPSRECRARTKGSDRCICTPCAGACWYRSGSRRSLRSPPRRFCLDGTRPGIPLASETCARRRTQWRILGLRQHEVGADRPSPAPQSSHRSAQSFGRVSQDPPCDDELVDLLRALV